MNRIFFYILMVLQFISYIYTFEVTLNFYYDDYLKRVYVNEKIVEGLQTDQVLTPTSFKVEATYGDKITFEVENNSGPMGLAGRVIINNDIFSTTFFINNWETTIPNGFDPMLYGILSYQRGDFYLGREYNGTERFTFTIPTVVTVNDESAVLGFNEIFPFDVTTHYISFYNEAYDKIKFVVQKFPQNGVLTFNDNSQVNSNTNYSPQIIYYTPNGFPNKETFEYAMTNSVGVLSRTGVVTLYTCWIGCQSCTKSNLCKNDDCTVFSKPNCDICCPGYGKFQVESESRMECWDNSKKYSGYYLDVVDNTYKSCYSTCQECSASGDKNDHQCEKCKLDYFWCTERKIVKIHLIKKKGIF